MARTYGNLLLARETGKDKRIGEIVMDTVSDTPVTMCRNRIVQKARAAGVDVLVMIDSDQGMMFHENEQGFKPFFESSFDFLCEHYDKGPCVIAAPYCGPPTHDHENVYVFRWRIKAERGAETLFFIDQYTREEAALMKGISEVAALPTGAIMYDMRCFDLIKPPYFNYEYKASYDEHGKEVHYEDDKGSTEDVQNTRDISIAGCLKLGYNPVFCNWDSPVGHWKPWCVRGRPRVYTARCVADSLKAAIDSNIMPGDVQVDLPLPSFLVPRKAEQFITDIPVVVDRMRDLPDPSGNIVAANIGGVDQKVHWNGQSCNLPECGGRDDSSRLMNATQQAVANLAATSGQSGRFVSPGFTSLTEQCLANARAGMLPINIK